MSVPMTADEIKIVLDKHAKYHRGESGGEHANLTGANLTGAYLTPANLAGANLTRANLTRANLTYANLAGAYLTRANLTGAYLTRANLTGAYLTGANLTDAYLTRANLTRANLTDANLTRADLAGADLTDANLAGANLAGAKLPRFQIPQEGDLTVFKKLSDGIIAKLLIPDGAKRTATPIGRKCRAEYAKVLDLGGATRGVGYHKMGYTYILGEIARPDSYDDDIRIECTHGIHFFLTRKEAEEYCR